MMPGAIGDRVSPRVPPLVAPLVCGLCRRTVDDEMCRGMRYENDRSAHRKCMQYSSNLAQHKTKEGGGFYMDDLEEERNRGKRLKCEFCKHNKKTKKGVIHGATCGCAIRKCNATFHYPCAKESPSAITARLFDDETNVLYRIFCSEDHKRRFDKENGNRYTYTDEMSDDEDDATQHSDHCITATLGSLTSHPPIQQDNIVSSSQQRKHKHSDTWSHSSSDSGASQITRSRSSCDSGGTLVCSEARPVKIDQSEPRSDSITSDPSLVLGTVERVSDVDQPITSTESSSYEMSPQHDEYVLCFVDCRDWRELTKQHRNEVETFALKLFSVPQKHVIIWVPKVDGTALKPSHGIYFMHNISQALREQSYPDLERLILGLSQRDFEEYESFEQLHKSFGTESCESIHAMMRHVIKANLSEAREPTGLRVGTVCKVFKKNVFMLFVHVCDTTDPLRRIRDTQPSIFRWMPDTCLESIAMLKTQEYFLQKELHVLKCWLECVAQPEESIFLQRQHHTTSTSSVVSKLIDYFQHYRSASSHGSSTVIFYDAIDNTAESGKQYLSMMLSNAITRHRDVFIVLGIKAPYRACTLTELVPSYEDNIEMDAYSFADPAYLPVTCVVLRFRMLS